MHIKKFLCASVVSCVIGGVVMHHKGRIFFSLLFIIILSWLNTCKVDPNLANPVVCLTGSHKVENSKSISNSYSLCCMYSILNYNTYLELEVTKHITPHTNGDPLLKWSSSHSHSSPVLQRFCLLPGLPTATVVVFLTSKASSNGPFTK